MYIFYRILNLGQNLSFETFFTEAEVRPLIFWEENWEDEQAFMMSELFYVYLIIILGLFSYILLIEFVDCTGLNYIMFACNI